MIEGIGLPIVLLALLGFAIFGGDDDGGDVKGDDGGGFRPSEDDDEGFLTNDDDSVNLLDGNDKVYGRDGDDFIRGAAGDDTVIGDGADEIHNQARATIEDFEPGEDVLVIDLLFDGEDGQADVADYEIVLT